MKCKVHTISSVVDDYVNLRGGIAEALPGAISRRERCHTAAASLVGSRGLVCVRTPSIFRCVCVCVCYLVFLVRWNAAALVRRSQETRLGADGRRGCRPPARVGEPRRDEAKVKVEVVE